MKSFRCVYLHPSTLSDDYLLLNTSFVPAEMVQWAVDFRDIYQVESQSCHRPCLSSAGRGLELDSFFHGFSMVIIAFYMNPNLRQQLS